MNKNKEKTPFDFLIAPILLQLVKCGCNPKVNNVFSKILWMFLFSTIIIWTILSLVHLHYIDIKDYDKAIRKIFGLIEILIALLMWRIYKRKYSKTMDLIEEKFWYQGFGFDETVYAKYKKYYKFLIIYIKFSNSIVFVMLFSMYSGPIINLERKFPYDMTFPYNNFIKKSPYFEIIYFIQAITVGIGSLYTNTHSDLLYFTSFSLVLIQIDLIKIKLKTVSQQNINKIEIYTNVCTCIKQHNIILKVSKNIDQCYSFFLFAKLLSMFLNGCFSVYLISTGSDSYLSVLFMSSIIASQSLIFCSFGQLITNEFDSIGQAAYNVKWEDFGNRPITFALAMIILRAQNQVVLKAGGIVELKIAYIVTFARTIFSYSAILKNFAMK